MPPAISLREIGPNAKELVAFLCGLASVVVAPSPLRADPSALEGSWRLLGAEPALPAVVRHKEIYETAGVKFSRGSGDHHHFTGSGACNSWSSHLEFKYDAPQFYKGPVMSTAQYCPDARADFDRAFGRALRLADSMTIAGDTLVTKGERGKLVFERRR